MMAVRTRGPVEEWVAFRDPDDPGWKWMFDVAFLCSGYVCTFGTSCKGCAGAPDVGACCEQGVYLLHGGDEDPIVTGPDPLELLRVNAAKLTAEDWQHHGELEVEDCIVPGEDPGSVKTALTGGACVFHNRADFEGGAGCALHYAAMRRDEDPLDWKPETCWLVPLQLSIDDDLRLKTVRAYHNFDDWGSGESESMDWWCVDDAANYKNTIPVYKSLGAELRRICGAQVYEDLVMWLDGRMGGAAPGDVPVNFIALLEAAPADGSTGRPV